MKLNTRWMMVLVVLAVTGCAGQDATQVEPDSENPLSVASSIVEVEVVSQAENLPDGTARSNNEYKSDPSLTTNAEPSMSAISASMVPENHASSDIVEQVSEEGLTESLNEPGQVEDTEGTIDNGVGSSSDTVDSPLEQDEVKAFEITAHRVTDCVVRGLVRNTSDTLYARDLEVLAVSEDSFGRWATGTWKWPLTVLPGEEVPFEIPNWSGSPNAREVYYQVSAKLADSRDLTRSFAIEYFDEDPTATIVFDEELLENDAFWSLTWKNFSVHLDSLLDYYPQSLIPEEVLTSNLFTVRSALVHYTEDNAQSWNDGVQQFDDLVIFQAVLDTRSDPESLGYHAPTVVEVRQLVPSYWDTEEVEFIAFGSMTELAKGSPDLQFEFPETTPLTLPGRKYGEHQDDGIPHTPSRFRSQLWVGGISEEVPPSNVVTQLILPSEYYHERFFDSGQPRDLYRPTCGYLGPLHHDTTVDPWQPPSIVYALGSLPMGYFGGSLGYQTPEPTTDDGLLIVEPQSVLLRDGTLRGMVYNPSDRLHVRDLTVTALNDDKWLGAWSWPLTVQPEEHIPFEIEGIPKDLEVSSIQLALEGNFSDDIDVSRAIKRTAVADGVAVGADYVDLRQSGQGFDRYLDNINDSVVSSSQYVEVSWLREEYPHWVLEPFEELTSDYIFVDFYLSVAPTTSHLSLNGKIESQSIENLRAYVAIVDDGRRILDVMELQPFMSLGAGDSEGERFVPVSSLPTLSEVNARAFRLLVLKPAERVNGRYTSFPDQREYRMWVGGATDPKQ